jgi:Arrestin (or S-antigen), N-terminal domain/Arrestin (or S-antigen), C-terminal domain
MKMKKFSRFFILGLRLIIEGEATCKWTESVGSGNTRRATDYLGEEKFLSSLSYLFGSKDGETVEVPAGVHNYKFACPLPPTVPYSVDGEHGHIRYKVDANVDIPWGFDLQADKTFTVCRREDLNEFAELRLPCEVEEIQTFCCWFCESDPLMLKVRLPKTGYALGEEIPVHVEMFNKSTKDVEKTIFTLKRVDTYNSQNIPKTKVCKEEIVESSSVGVKAGETVSFDHAVQIPQTLMLSNKRSCSVYQISYELKVTAETKGISVSPELHIPITLGTVGFPDEKHQ